MSAQPFVTVFRSTAGEITAARSMSMEELERVIQRGPTVDSEAGKTTLPLLKLARFGEQVTAKGSFRSDENVVQVFGVEGDYDGEQVSIEAAAEMLKLFGVEALLHTSARHRPDAPRWRVFCPLSVPLEGDTAQLKAQHGYWTDRLNGALGGILSPESWALSQAYFFGSIAGFTPLTSIRLDGKCLDQLDTLPPAIGKPGKAAPTERTQADGGRIEAGEDIEAIASGAHIYAPVRRLTGRYVAKGLPVPEAVAMVRSLLLQHKAAWNDHLPRWQEAYDKTPRLTQDAADKLRNGKWTPIRNASVADDGNWPEPRPLPPELHPVQPFDLALLPDSLRPWITDVCERVQCPPDYIAVPVMVALGSLIGRKVRIRPKARDSWTVVPNVWGGIIGRPGTMKSPALTEALHPLRRLEAQARDEYEALDADYETQSELSKLRKDAAKDKVRTALKSGKGDASVEALRVEVPDEPILRRYTAHQSSMQALGELLRQNPNGLMVERDELAGLLSNLTQEEKAEERGFYLTGADGVQGFTFDTIGRGLNLRVPAVCLSIIGTTQPGKIGRYLRQAQAGGEGDDGMMQRFGLLVWPDSPHDWRNVDRWPDTEARRQAFSIFERLDTLTAESVGAETDDDCSFLRFDADAIEAFTEWRTALETRLRSGELHPALESHFAKYRKTIPALALILHLAEGDTGPVTLRATLRALAWADYLESHALRCYGATVAGERAAARRILARIHKGELVDGFKAREIDRAGWSDLTDRDTVRAALALLVTHGYLAEVELPSTAAGGRPTLAYRIHPSLRHELA